MLTTVILQLLSWGLGLLWSHHRQTSNRMLINLLCSLIFFY